MEAKKGRKRQKGCKKKKKKGCERDANAVLKGET